MRKVDVALEGAQARIALRALDKILRFDDPDQVLVFRPLDHPTVTKAWAKADAVLRPKKS